MDASDNISTSQASLNQQSFSYSDSENTSRLKYIARKILLFFKRVARVIFIVFALYTTLGLLVMHMENPVVASILEVVKWVIFIPGFIIVTLLIRFIKRAIVLFIRLVVWGLLIALILAALLS